MANRHLLKRNSRKTNLPRSSTPIAPASPHLNCRSSDDIVLMRLTSIFGAGVGLRSEAKHLQLPLLEYMHQRASGWQPRQNVTPFETASQTLRLHRESPASRFAHPIIRQSFSLAHSDCEWMLRVH